VKGALSYLSEVRLELSKVTWPKRQDVIKLTLIILLISGIVAVYLGSLDYALTKLFEAIIIN
jgi:preprotein translocase subunit SecE